MSAEQSDDRTANGEESPVQQQPPEPESQPMGMLSAAAAAAVERAESLERFEGSGDGLSPELEAAAGAYHEAAMLLLHDIERLAPDERRDARAVQMQEQAERLAARAAELRQLADAGRDSDNNQGVEGDEGAAEEAVPGVLAGVPLQRIKTPKAPGTKYRCIGNAVVRKGCAMDSDKAKVDKLEAGQEITVLERVTLDDGTERLRFEDGAPVLPPSLPPSLCVSVSVCVAWSTPLCPLSTYYCWPTK